VESIRHTSYPARSKGVATARMPKGAVASELAKDGKKKTILRDLPRAISSFTVDNMSSSRFSCQGDVSSL